MKIPKCFGHYARFMYEEGVSPEVCIQCEVAEHCYRATTVDSLNSLAADVGLLMDNLLEQGKVADYADLGGGEGGGDDDGDEFGVLPPTHR
jgi:hypothetical protein